MKIFRSITALCMLLLAALASTPSSADVLVLRSDSDRLEAGSSVKSGSLLRIRTGRTLLLLQADGTTVDLRGPTTFIVPETQISDQSVLRAFTAMFKARADSVRLGGVRNGSPHCAEKTDDGSWKDIADDWNVGCRQAALDHLSAQLNN